MPVIRRDKNIKRMIETNHTYSEIGAKYNLSRERVRQIAAKLGVEAINSLKSKQELKLKAIALLKKGKSHEVVAKQTGLATSTISSTAAKIGEGKIARRKRLQTVFVKEIVERLENGETYSAIANGNHALAERIRRYALENGVCSKFSHKFLMNRAQIILGGLQKHKTWKQITADVSRKEGRKVKIMTLRTWYRNNHD